MIDIKKRLLNSVPKNLAEIPHIFLAKLKATNSPQYIEVKLAKWAKQCDCFNNVSIKIKKSGGKQVLGWAIWQDTYALQAEFHSVWENKNGKLYDITPREFEGEKLYYSQIVFVRDDNAIYKGELVNNIRMNLSNNPLVDDILVLCDFLYYLMKIELKPTSQDDLESLNKKANILYGFINKHIAMLHIMIDKEQTIDSLCFCNSRKEYKKCHGYQLKETLTKLCKELFECE